MPYDQSQLARVVSKLQVAELTDESFEEYFSAFEESAIASALDSFGPGHTIKIRAREGSLLVAITVLGAIGASVLGAQKFLVDYPKMKEGLRELVNDANSFGRSLEQKISRDIRKKPAKLESVTTTSLAPQEMISFLDEAGGDDEELPTAERRIKERRALLRLKALARHLSESDKEALITALEKSKMPGLPKIRNILISPQDGAAHSPRIHREQLPLELPPAKVRRRRRRTKSKTIHL